MLLVPVCEAISATVHPTTNFFAWRSHCVGRSVAGRKGNCNKTATLHKCIAKHFLVIIATTLSASAKHKHTFLVARYGLKKVDEECIYEALTKSYIALAKDGWVAVKVSGDGASENRSYFKKAATLSARDVFDGIYDGDNPNAPVLEGLPLDFKIAFPHPDPYLRDNGIIIFIGGEVPHSLSTPPRYMCVCYIILNVQ